MQFRESFAVLACLWVIGILGVCARDYRSTTFQASLQPDNIVYTNVRVPRHAQSVRIKINFQDECLWIAKLASSSNDSVPLLQPTVFIRYDGVPRIDKFDASYTLPQYPESLEILDDSPSEAVMYIAVWGGALLNSYRYFAGSPDRVDIGVDVEIEACDSELQFGSDCLQNLQILPLSTGTDDKTTTTVPLFFVQTHEQHAALVVPRGVNDIQVRTTLTPESIGSVCDAYKAAAAAGRHAGLDTAAHVMQLVLRVYRNQPDEDIDSSKVTAQVGLHAVCAPAANSMLAGAVLLQQMQVLLERPLPGLWIVALHLGVHSTPSTSSLLDGDTVNLQVDVETLLMQCPSGYVGRNDVFHVERFKLAPATPGEAAGGSGSYKHAPGNATDVNCQIPIIDLESTRKSDPFRNVAHLWSRDTHVLQESYIRSAEGIVSYARRDAKSEVSDAAKELAHEETGAKNVESAELGATEQPYAAFAASLEHTDINSILGGVLHVQLRVRPYVDELSRLGLHIDTKDSPDYEVSASKDPDVPVPPDSAAAGAAAETPTKDLTQDELHKWLKETTFFLAIRGGAMAGSPSSRFSQVFSGAGDSASQHKDLNQEIEEKDYVDSLSENSLTLSTSTATVATIIDASATDEEGNLLYELPEMLEQSLPLPTELRYDHFLGTEDEKVDTSRRGLLYTWTIEKPAIKGLGGSTFYSSRSLYVRVSKRGKSPLENFIVSIHVSFQPCAASSCGGNGLCYTHAGEVSVSACECAYPYGGHDCDTLSIPYGFYIVQVVTLLASNLAMIPAIILCLRIKLPVIAVILALASLSSMLYHACDTDYYCIYDADNTTLQLFDVFFCVLSFQSILIFHSTWDSEKNVTVLMLLIGILLPGIAEDPTNIFWIAMSIAVAICLTVGSWMKPILIKLYRKHRAKDASEMRGRDGDGTGYEEVQMQNMDSKHGNNVAGDDTLDSSRGSGNSSDSAHNPLQISETNRSIDSLEMNDSVEDGDENDSFSGGWTAAVTKASTAQKSAHNHNIMGFTGRLDFSKANVTCLLRMCCTIRYTLYGLAIMGIGVSCFAFQSRTTYWMTHSMWHAITMISSYFCLKGMPTLRANAARFLQEI